MNRWEVMEPTEHEINVVVLFLNYFRTYFMPVLELGAKNTLNKLPFSFFSCRMHHVVGTERSKQAHVV